MRRSIPLLLVLACALSAGPLAAQARPRGSGPEARMDAFLHMMRERDDSLSAFFPRRAEVAWVLTTHDPARGRVAGRSLFRPSEVLRAMEWNGPLCETFSLGGDAITVGTLMYRIWESPGRWRRVGAARFVPPGASARSPTFVEWRREDGRWVIAAFGDERWSGPRLLGVERNHVVRDAAPAGGAAASQVSEVYAAGAPWFEEHEPIRAEGHGLVKYGLPRPLSPDEIRRYGTVNGVAAYVEAGSRGRPEVLYVAVAPGRYQPYQNMTSTGCS